MSQLVTRWVITVTFLLGLVCFSTPAAAQDPGIRGGISVNPDQFYVGGHLETKPLVDRLYFRPNIEIGFGDNLTLIGANMEFVYKFSTKKPMNLYVGGGPALNIVMVDNGNDNNSDTEAGFNFMVGAETPKGLFFEFKIGAMDSPDLKFGVGYTWR